MSKLLPRVHSRASLWIMLQQHRELQRVLIIHGYIAATRMRITCGAALGTIIA